MEGLIDIAVYYLASLMTYVLMVGMALVVFFTPVLLLLKFIVAFFSPEIRQNIRKRKILHILWFAVSVVILTSYSLEVVATRIQKEKTHSLMKQIQTAILSYQTEYGEPPAGNGNAALIKTLEGDNPRKIEFLSLKPTDINTKGEVLDAWGTPLIIQITDPHHPTIRSAGPDKTWNQPYDL